MGMSHETAEELFGTLQILDRVLRWGFRAHRQPDDPGPGAQATLFYLLRNEPARAKDIAEWLGIGAAPQSRQLADLEQNGLISREPDPDDARAARIRLTEEGRATVLALRERRIAVIQKSLAEMDAATADSAVTALRGVVEEMRDGLAEMIGQSPTRPTVPPPSTQALPSVAAPHRTDLTDSKDTA